MSSKTIYFNSNEAASNSNLVFADISLAATLADNHLKPLDRVNVNELVYKHSDDVNDNNNIMYSKDGKLIFADAAELSSIQDNMEYNKRLSEKAVWKLQKNINATAVKEAIRNIFSWTPGERILNPEFGSNLRKYLYEGITDFNKEQIMSEIRHCVLEWEPRANITEVYDISTTNDHENNTVRLEIQYTIPELSPEQYSFLYETQLVQ